MSRICQIFGHRREYYPATVMRIHRRGGYWFPNKETHVRCNRCWASGPDACYDPGIIEWLLELARAFVSRVESAGEPPIENDPSIPF